MADDAESDGDHDPVMWVLHRVSLVGVAVAGVLVAAWMLQGRAHFGDLFGIGLVYAGAIGMICAFCYGGTEPTLCDPMNARNHWRGHLQTAAVVMVVAAVGGVVSALT